MDNMAVICLQGVRVMEECGLVLVLVNQEVELWIMVSVRPPSVLQQVLGALAMVSFPAPSFL